MSVIRDLVNTVDNSKQNAEQIKETIGILMNLAESKGKNFLAIIDNDLLTGKTNDNLTISITKKLAQREEYRAYTANKGTDVIKNVGASFSKIFSGDGNILNSVAGILTDTLNAIMGEGQGTETIVQTYMVIEEYPAIVRYDFAMWSRSIQSKSIREYVENAFACVACKSAVDVTKLSFNDFLALYGPVLRGAYGADQKKLDEMVEKCKNIYRQFTNDLILDNMGILADTTHDHKRLQSRTRVHCQTVQREHNGLVF